MPASTSRRFAGKPPWRFAANLHARVSPICSKSRRRAPTIFVLGQRCFLISQRLPVVASAGTMLPLSYRFVACAGLWFFFCGLRRWPSDGDVIGCELGARPEREPRATGTRPARDWSATRARLERDQSATRARSAHAWSAINARSARDQCTPGARSRRAWRTLGIRIAHHSHSKPQPREQLHALAALHLPASTIEPRCDPRVHRSRVIRASFVRQSHHERVPVALRSRPSVAPIAQRRRCIRAVQALRLCAQSVH